MIKSHQHRTVSGVIHIVTFDFIASETTWTAGAVAGEQEVVVTQNFSVTYIAPPFVTAALKGSLFLTELPGPKFTAPKLFVEILGITTNQVKLRLVTDNNTAYTYAEATVFVIGNV